MKYLNKKKSNYKTCDKFSTLRKKKKKNLTIKVIQYILIDLYCNQSKSIIKKTIEFNFLEQDSFLKQFSIKG